MHFGTEQAGPSKASTCRCQRLGPLGLHTTSKRCFSPGTAFPFNSVNMLLMRKGCCKSDCDAVLAVCEPETWKYGVKNSPVSQSLP